MKILEGRDMVNNHAIAKKLNELIVFLGNKGMFDEEVNTEKELRTRQ